MNILINAISIAKGGGFVVLTHMLDAAIKTNQDITWYVVAEPGVIARLPQSEKIIGVPNSWARKSPLHLMFWYEFVLPKLLKKYNAKVCFSHTNFLPRRKLPCPSLLLVHQAGFFSPKYKKLQFYWYKSKLSQFLFKQKIKWVKDSIRKATKVTIQTEALAIRIIKQIKAARNKLVVIPHGTGLITQQVQLPRKYPENTVFRVGYITKMGVQKDFETAIHAIKILKDKDIPVKLILTLDEDDVTAYPMYRHVMTLIKKYQIEELVEQYGDIANSDKIKELYESLHLFIFPSLCESFGFTLVEAMSNGLPVIAADTDSNCEVTSFAGELFASEDPRQLAKKIERLISNKSLYESASLRSLERARYFCWKKTANNILEVLKDLTDRHETNADSLTFSPARK